MAVGAPKHWRTSHLRAMGRGCGSSKTLAHVVLESYRACPGTSWGWSWECLREFPGKPRQAPKRWRTSCSRAMGHVLGPPEDGPGDACGSSSGSPSKLSKTPAHIVLESYGACPGTSRGWCWGCLWELLGKPLQAPKHWRTSYLRAIGHVLAPPEDGAGDAWGSSWGSPSKLPNTGARRT